MFKDKARILVKGGDGGHGVVAFRREKFMPMGGPSGGSGGRGGSVILVVDTGLNTLFHFRHNVQFQAERGTHGQGKDMTGAVGKDLYIRVPPGTIVRNAETSELIADLIEPGQEAIIARGGRAGRGNAAFKSPRNPAPRLAEKGEPGEVISLELELKLVADVGIIGVPNAGKSTLLSVISAARPKIADYPFTTVSPNLGVAEVDHVQIVMADIPGLLEGAHEGVGLGLEFLRHIERTRMVIHLLRGDSPDPLGDFEAINQELSLFNPAMVDKVQLVVFGKMDLPEAQERWPEVEKAIIARGLPVLAISAVMQQNVDQMMYKVRDMLTALPKELPSSEPEAIEITLPLDEKAFEIQKVGAKIWKVEGVVIDRAARMTNWDYYEAGMRFQRILKALGISDALREAGIQEGDTVQIAEIELVWGHENAFAE